MGTPPRIDVPGAVIALTRRTAFRKLFWTCGELAGVKTSDVFLYAFAIAQERTKVPMHHITLMPNHHHTMVTNPGGALGEFTRLAHRESSAALKSLLRQADVELPENIWSAAAKTHQERLVNVSAQVQHAVYQRENVVSAGLVSRVDDYPGLVTSFGDWKRGYITVARPPIEYFDDCAHPMFRRIFLTPSAQMLAEFRGDLNALIYFLQKLDREHEAQLRREKGKPLGADKLLLVHPWDEPKMPRNPIEEERGPAATFKVVGNSKQDVELRVQCALETRHYRTQYRGIEADWRDESIDNSTLVYPYGTTKRALYDNVEVAEPLPDAVLICPIEIIEAGHDKALQRAELKRVCKEELDNVRSGVDETLGERIRVVLDGGDDELLVKDSMTSVDPTARRPRHIVVRRDHVRNVRVRVRGTRRVRQKDET